MAQGALLAAVIKSPELLRPCGDAVRVEGSLGLCRAGHGEDAGKLTDTQAAALKFPARRSRPNPSVRCWTGRSAWSGARSRRSCPRTGSIRPAINTKGLKIQTTIDKSAQAAAESAISEHMTGLASFQKNLLPALSAVNPSSGAVLAYVRRQERRRQYDLANGDRPAGLVVQAVHARHRADAGNLAADDVRLEAGLDLPRQQVLVRPQLRGRVPRADQPRAGDHGVGQLGVLAADDDRRPGAGGDDGAQRPASPGRCRATSRSGSASSR